VYIIDFFIVNIYKGEEKRTKAPQKRCLAAAFSQHLLKNGAQNN
jgi:hypothetical protein